MTGAVDPLSIQRQDPDEELLESLIASGDTERIKTALSDASYWHRYIHSVMYAIDFAVRRSEYLLRIILDLPSVYDDVLVNEAALYLSVEPYSVSTRNKIAMVFSDPRIRLQTIVTIISIIVVRDVRILAAIFGSAPVGMIEAALEASLTRDNVVQTYVAVFESDMAEDDQLKLVNVLARVPADILARAKAEMFGDDVLANTGSLDQIYFKIVGMMLKAGFVTPEFVHEFLTRIVAVVVAADDPGTFDFANAHVVLDDLETVGREDLAAVLARSHPLWTTYLETKRWSLLRSEWIKAMLRGYGSAHGPTHASSTNSHKRLKGFPRDPV